MSLPKAMQSFDLIEIGEYAVYLNGERAPRKFQDLGSMTSLHSFIELPPQCPFCKSSILTCGSFDLSDFYYSGEGKAYYLWYCRYCRFWQWYYAFDRYAGDEEWEGEGCPPRAEERARISKLRVFSDLPESCSGELAQYLRRKPSEWHRFNPKRFEKLVADIFRANYENAEVIHVGKPDDGGKDIIFIDSNNQQSLIQVKRRERETCSEGVSTIRNLIGTMILDNVVRGIVVSTADHFSIRAQQAVERVAKQGLHIELIDKGVLNRMLDPVLPDRPWLESVDSDDSEVASWLGQQISSDDQLKLFDI